MDELIRFEIIKMPKLWIIGKEIRYRDDALNNGDNRLPGFWNKCYEEDIFAPLEMQKEHLYDESYAGVFLDWYLGDGNFSYIVGMLMTEGASAPTGYFTRELPETDAALCWIKCKGITETRAVSFDSTAAAIKDSGRDFGNMKWCIDLYNRQRSTIPDEDGNVILDCYIPLDPE